MKSNQESYDDNTDIPTQEENIETESKVDSNPNPDENIDPVKSDLELFSQFENEDFGDPFACEDENVVSTEQLIDNATNKKIRILNCT